MRHNHWLTVSTPSLFLLCICRPGQVTSQGLSSLDPFWFVTFRKSRLVPAGSRASPGRERRAARPLVPDQGARTSPRRGAVCLERHPWSHPARVRPQPTEGRQQQPRPLWVKQRERLPSSGVDTLFCDLTGGIGVIVRGRCWADFQTCRRNVPFISDNVVKYI